MARTAVCSLALCLVLLFPSEVLGRTAQNDGKFDESLSESDLNVSDILDIHQVLNRYCRIVDEKAFELLDQVFLPNAVANYSAPVNLLNGTTEIGSIVGNGLQYVTSQHMMGTWVWYPGEVADLPAVQPVINGQCGGVPRVKSEIYFTANMFGTGKYLGQKVEAAGYYIDNLVKVKQNDTTCAWRIASRQLVHQGPEFGNDTIFQAS